MEINQEEYFSHFNRAFAEFQDLQNEETMASVNRNLTLISSIMAPNLFNPIHRETCLFYINLYKLIKEISPESNVLWSAIAALEQATTIGSPNEGLKAFKFVPVLVSILAKMNGKCKTKKVLKILRSLTYQERIIWDAPLLQELLRALLQVLRGDDETMVHLSGSVLVNVCLKNASAVYVLSQMANIDEVFECLSKHRILKFKLQFAVKDLGQGELDLDVETLVESLLGEIEKALRTWNYDVLQHVVEFLEEFQGRYPAYLHGYQGYRQLMERLLGLFETKIAKEEDQNPTEKAVTFKGYFMKLLGFIRAKCKAQFMEDKLLEVALKWCSLPPVSPENFKLMLQIAKSTDFKSFDWERILKKYLAEFEVVLKNVMFEVEPAAHLLQLLYFLTVQAPETVNLIPVECFEPLAEKLLGLTLVANSTLSTTETEAMVFGMAIMSCFQDSVVFERVVQSPNCICVVLQGLMSKDDELTKMSLSLMQILPFSQETALTISAFNSLKKPEFPTSVSYPKFHVGFNIDEQMETLVDRILDESDVNQNLLLAELVELFEYKMSVCRTTERLLLSQIELAGAEVVAQSQQSALLEAELLSVKEKNFKLQESFKRFQENKNANEEQSRKELEDILNRINETEGNFRDLRASIAQKTLILRDVNVNLKALQENQQSKQSKVQEKFKNFQEDFFQLKNSFSSLVEELSQANARQTKLAEELRDKTKENQKLQQKVNELEAKVEEKCMQVQEYEDQLLEGDAIRTRVLEIVRCRKLKRSESQKDTRLIDEQEIL